MKAYPTCETCDRPMSPFTIAQQLTPEELDRFRAELTEHLTVEQMIAHVKKLEEKLSDWAFTLALADHFDQLREKYRQETAKDAIAQRLRPRTTAAEPQFGRMPDAE